MERILKKFFELTTNPYSSLAEWKEKNKKKIIGCYPMYLPEEIIHAAGMLPVVIWRSNEPVTMGHAHVAPFNCGLTRSFVDDAVKGKLSFLDGMVFYRMCLQAQSLPFIIERNARPSYVEYLYLPALYPGASIRDYLIEEFERLKKSLEEFSGQEITVRSLNQSISVYNRNRQLLAEVYALRREKPGLIKGREMQAIVNSSMLMPKEEHNQLLEELIPELKKRSPADQKVRMVIYGGLCQTVQPEVLDLIESLGMVIVDDDMYVGSRYFANEVEASEKPIESLANRYLKKLPPCPTKGDWETDWTDYVIEIVKRNKAQGVITMLVKFCPPHLCYYPDLKRKFAEHGIPEVLIELEHEVVSMEQTRTRLQSFIEIIGGV